MNELPIEDQLSILRHHSINLAGYAFALAKRQGMSPEEAAGVWMEPTMQRISGETVEATAWLERNAAAMAIFHREARLNRESNAWSITVDVRDELPPLEAWDAIDFWVSWMGEQTRLVAARQGLQATARLEDKTLALHFERLPKET